MNNRTGAVLNQYDTVDGTCVACRSMVTEARERISKAEALMGNLSAEPGGSSEHPLGTAPFRTTLIRFQLTRCLAIAERMERAPAPGFPFDPSQGLLYPSLRVAVFRTVIRAALRIRALATSRPIDYGSSYLLELLYLMCPSGFVEYGRRVALVIAHWIFRTGRIHPEGGCRPFGFEAINRVFAFRSLAGRWIRSNDEE